MEQETQQEFLMAAKVTLNVTWDALAALTDITPRALKTYRMPANSQDFRTMPKLARNAVLQALEKQRRERR